MLTQERLKEVLRYDPETGIFMWLVYRNQHVEKGDVAGYKSHGYIDIGIDGKRYPAHRLAFLYMEGAFPVNYVDHRNHKPDDNRWINLRPATQSENIINSKKSKSNTSGKKGVHWHKKNKKWIVLIGINSKQKYLGCFTDKQKAANAYDSAALELYGEFANINGRLRND